jgi:hemoglobin/transferrin/lactoferrin receptor protein
MKYFCLPLFACLFLTHIQAQTRNDDSAQKVIQLEEVVISANKFVEKKKYIAQKIDIITARQIATANTQNTGDLLMNTGNVFVQKSQQGGSSPVIRGFEASRVLLVVDGIRMNNAIYRSGHLQNVITVDQNMLERVEVLYGPASTIYGSDALGGVLLFRTKSPKLASNGSFLSTGSVFVRYSSANDEKTFHGDISIAGKRIGWLQSYNFSNFGNMKMGDNYPDMYPDFGRRSEYIAMINGVDSIVKNPDDRVQYNSGYKQWDITQKLLFKQSDKIQHLLNIQLSNTNDVPRYDRLQDIRNAALRYAEWYYGPQKRLLGAYELSIGRTGFFNEIKANLSFQDIEESRQTRDYKRYDRLDSRVENIQVWALTIDGRKIMHNHELTIGLDGQLNDLTSTATRINTITGAPTKLDTRYPDGKNNMNYFGVYAQHLFKLKEEKLVLNDGIRLQYINLHSTISDNSFFKLPVTDIKQENLAVTGNLGLILLPRKSTRLALSLSSGFRAPNIDDLAKIFESSTAAKQVVIPNPDIKPEYTRNADLSVMQVFAEKIKLEITGYYTWFRNALVKAPFQLNGQDSIIYNGVNSRVFANQNRNKAYVYGASAALAIDITNHLSFQSNINFSKGRFQTKAGETSNIYKKQSNGAYQMVTEQVTSKPLDHIPPVFGKTSVRYYEPRYELELFALYNGWKHLDDYNADGEDNAQYATPDGMPGWYTINLRSRLSITDNISVQLAIENIFDRNYRHFASGFSAAGRNFIGTVRVQF